MTLTHLFFFVIALITALIITPYVRALGTRFEILDSPGKRKVHQKEIPRLGGIAIFIATLLPFLGFLFWGDFMTQEIHYFWKPLLGLTLGCLIVFGIGIWDDIRRLPPWPKLLAEFVAATVTFLFGLKIQLLSNPFGIQLDLSWLSGPITILWLVGITNALNLADGIDGLAVGIATFASAILFIMTSSSIYTLVPYLTVALAGASLGFLRYNFSPATIFLGDSGSLFSGILFGRPFFVGLGKKRHCLCLIYPDCCPRNSDCGYDLCGFTTLASRSPYRAGRSRSYSSSFVGKGILPSPRGADALRGKSFFGGPGRLFAFYPEFIGRLCRGRPRRRVYTGVQTSGVF